MRTMLTAVRVGEVTRPERIMQTAHSKGNADHGVESARDLAYDLERVRGGLRRRWDLLDINEPAVVRSG